MNKRTATNPYASLHRRFRHMQILGLHTITPIPICRSSLLKQYTDAPSGGYVLGRCASLPYGILKADTASMLATKAG